MTFMRGEVTRSKMKRDETGGYPTSADKMERFMEKCFELRGDSWSLKNEKVNKKLSKRRKDEDLR